MSVECFVQSCNSVSILKICTWLPKYVQSCFFLIVFKQNSFENNSKNHLKIDDEP